MARSRSSAEFARHELARHAPGMAASRGAARTSSVPANGFTLIEMLVALAIFSLAALALLRLGGATAANSARLTEQALAQTVARNLAVEAMTDPVPPGFGTESGMVDNAGRQWRWVRLTERSPEARIQLITIRVTGASGVGQATMTLFRPAG